MASILVIDDEAPIRKMLKKLLERNGHNTLEAENGNQGLKVFKTAFPDLIITDLIMPDKEGIETILELKKLDPDVKIIAISGGGVTEPEMYLDLARRFGAARAFTKPVDNKTLINAVNELLA